MGESRHVGAAGQVGDLLAHAVVDDLAGLVAFGVVHLVVEDLFVPVLQQKLLQLIGSGDARQDPGVGILGVGDVVGHACSSQVVGPGVGSSVPWGQRGDVLAGADR